MVGAAGVGIGGCPGEWWTRSGREVVAYQVRVFGQERPVFDSWREILDKQYRAEKKTHFGAWDRCCRGFMYCMSFARRALSVSRSSVSSTAALRLRDTGTVGVDTRSTLFAIRVKCGSGSKQSGGAVAICEWSAEPTQTTESSSQAV